MSVLPVYVGLDFSDAERAFALVRQLIPFHPYYKVGLELFVAEGPDLISRLKGEGANIFLDLKFHDIPNTVAGAVRSSTRLGVQYLNVHCGGGLEMMRAARAAAEEESSRLSRPRPKLLGVTVLTSSDDATMKEIGFDRSTADQVKRFVSLAQQGGLDGVVCSAHEVAIVRELAGTEFVTMVPGIRPAGAALGDQKRAMTPAEAKHVGAHCLVIGRPVTSAADPVAALKQILSEVGAA